jgi:hypothetical protein
MYLHMCANKKIKLLLNKKRSQVSVLRFSINEPVRSKPKKGDVITNVHTSLFASTGKWTASPFLRRTIFYLIELCIQNRVLIKL